MNSKGERGCFKVNVRDIPQASTSAGEATDLRQSYPRAEMRGAGRLLLDYYEDHYERRTDVEWKHSGDPVKRADGLAAQPASDCFRARISSRSAPAGC